MISIVVPVYNSARWLDACIESICRQTMPDWELVLVDDGSTDGSDAIVRDWEKRDGRIRSFRKENGGVSSARNFGIDRARGEYLMFVDSDDVCSPLLLETLHGAMTPSCGLSACGIRRFRADSEVAPAVATASERVLPAKSEIYSYLEDCGMLHPPYAKLFRTETIRKNRIRFDENLSLGEDLLFNLDYLQWISSAVAIGSSLYFYRDTDGSLSKKIRADYAEIQLRLLDSKLRFIENNRVDYSYSSKAPGIVRDMFLSLCRSEGSDRQKINSLGKLRRHKVMDLCGNSARLSDRFLIAAIRCLPSKLLIKIF